MRWGAQRLHLQVCIEWHKLLTRLLFFPAEDGLKSLVIFFEGCGSLTRIRSLLGHSLHILTLLWEAGAFAPGL